MTELYIDGTSVVLPADFSTSVKRENPFFTKNVEDDGIEYAMKKLKLI